MYEQLEDYLIQVVPEGRCNTLINALISSEAVAGNDIDTLVEGMVGALDIYSTEINVSIIEGRTYEAVATSLQQLGIVLADTDTPADDIKSLSRLVDDINAIALYDVPSELITLIFNNEDDNVDLLVEMINLVDSWDEEAIRYYVDDVDQGLIDNIKADAENKEAMASHLTQNDITVTDEMAARIKRLYANEIGGFVRDYIIEGGTPGLEVEDYLLLVGDHLNVENDSYPFDVVSLACISQGDDAELEDKCRYIFSKEDIDLSRRSALWSKISHYVNKALS